MNIIPLLLTEFEQETQTTRKMLALVPDNKFDWKPHQKSMTMKQLSSHVAEIPSWPAMMLVTSRLDFAAQPYTPPAVESTADLQQVFEKAVETTKEAFNNAKEEDLLPNWTLSSGDQVFGVFTKYEAIRHAFSQQTHHRAQLGVYLRLLNIPIPGSYGPSADEMGM